MVSPAEKRSGSGHFYTSLKLGYLLEAGKQELRAGERGLSSVTDDHCNLLAQGYQVTG